MARVLANERGTFADLVEREVVNDILARFEPRPGSCWSGIQLTTRHIPSVGFGGDFHHAFPGSEHHHALVVGSVRGQGLGVAFARAILSGEAAKLGNVRREPCELVNDLDRSLGHIRADLGGFRVNLSLFHGVVDRSANRLMFCHTGGLCPMILKNDGQVADLSVTPSALKDGAGYGTAMESLDLSGIRRLIVCTAGLMEARSPTGRTFREVWEPSLFRDTAGLDADRQADFVIRTLREHVGADHVFMEDATIFTMDWASAKRVSSVREAMQCWLETCESTSSRACDPSVFLG